ncbi:chaoptin [Daktulosphaira vitifoliae]|uniref:chaoptin n=1 Tax=Daktulosphaira vitifoliae TaxID=58002 RepID=UPI0021AAA4A2|nr:chaoptin [Daktulosphaira vitifoliae]XP_050523467.1 chaoptin [Daktulosphaira vitifoliae]XP_050523468.1 chaoptin [Daktulosphaira vitifoliae]XP_050523469.1 chaoptin [Daktulosphaira vitifoliae]XP_050523470.1 chaoptin [Daktulosphaira vitifoliae]XP_050523471.1 chaoptin [Daktulosphaira vitifoliae]
MTLCFPVFLIMLTTSLANPCTFNSMCTCKTDEALRMHIACVSVPFYTMPIVEVGTRISHMDVISSEIEVVENDILQDTHIESLRLMSNKISTVADKAFASSGSVLRALDISFNQLNKVPMKALTNIKSLDWLNLHGNNIEKIEPQWNHLQDTLQHLFIGENDLTIFPESLSKLRSLSTLNLDNNLITTISTSLKTPPLLETLSISNNFLQDFPIFFTELGTSLNRLYIRDNYIENMTKIIPNRFVKLEVLDLGMNRIQSWTGRLFDGRSEVRNLHMDMNQIEVLEEKAFEGLRSVRMYLSHNRLRSINHKTFEGLERILEYLDLEHNKLGIIPTAVRTLKNLKFLYLSSNGLNHIDVADFAGVSSSLRSLSLSGNRLTEIPSMALENCTKLSHLNLGYNFIREIKENDFEVWAEHLDTLLLMNNKLTELTGRPFKKTMVLRELSLSFNNIHYVDTDVFLDLANSLESLEISFSVYYDNFPVKILKHLKSLLWLVLDNNDILSVPVNSFHTLDKLQYINMESNKISVIAPKTFSSTNLTYLREIRLNQNNLMSLDSNTFLNLQQLQTITLSRNKIIEIMSHAFNNLPRLFNIDLSFNKIEYIQPSAFYSLPNLKRIDLQGNQLKELRITSFINSTNSKQPLLLNVSRNYIERAPVDDPLTPIHVKILDLSYNNLQDIPFELLYLVSGSMKNLYLDHNKISKIYDSEFVNLFNLEILSLAGNGITSIAQKSFSNLTSLQILDLSHNKIQHLYTDQLAILPKLRILSLSGNYLNTISWDIVSGAPLESLDLSNNQFLTVPTGVLFHTGSTLRHLLLSGNQIDHIDGTTFSGITKLANLSLANNKLTIIPDNAFVGLSSLLSLDLSSNNLRANFKELFHYIQNLKHLNLANTGLTESPSLPLPNLVSLRLSHNKLKTISRDSMEMLSRLRSLFIDYNELSYSPANVWSYLPSLKLLDISSNPIKTITKASFMDLSRLQHLRAQQLHYLDRFDAGSLSKLSTLRSLTTDWRENLGQIVCATAHSIHTLSIYVNRIRLPGPIVDHCGPKIDSIEITGPKLRILDPSVFDGLQLGTGDRLTISIRNTAIEDLPADLLLPLVGIPKLTLDLTGNKLTSLNPSTIYSNYTSWENSGTNILKGGLFLEDNPLQCDCGLLWLGQWLRRWLREAVQVHTLGMAESQMVQSTVRRATCTDPRNDAVRIPIADIYPEDLRCKASALSGSGTGNTATKTSHLIICLVRALAVFYLATIWCNVC